MIIYLWIMLINKMKYFSDVVPNTETTSYPFLVSWRNIFNILRLWFHWTHVSIENPSLVKNLRLLQKWWKKHCEK